MIRQYKLVKRHGSSVLICEIRRFLRDMPCVLSHSFDTGTTSITAPQSWTTLERADCYRQFDELLRSPHWLAEIQPCLMRYDDDYLSLFDAF